MSLPAPVPVVPVLEVVIDPDELARRAAAVPPPGPAAARLVAAAHGLAAALVVALPAGSAGPQAGGRSAAPARALAEHWSRLAGTWADDVSAHLAATLGAGEAFARSDRDGAAAFGAVTGTLAPPRARR